MPVDVKVVQWLFINPGFEVGFMKLTSVRRAVGALRSGDELVAA